MALGPTGLFLLIFTLAQSFPFSRAKLLQLSSLCMASFPMQRASMADPNYSPEHTMQPLAARASWPTLQAPTRDTTCSPSITLMDRWSMTSTPPLTVTFAMTDQPTMRALHHPCQLLAVTTIASPAPPTCLYAFLQHTIFPVCNGYST